MKVDKEQVLELLRSQGQDDKAEQAEATLPEKVDPDAHADLLHGLGIEPQDLVGRLGGLGGLGGLSSLGDLGGQGSDRG
jgi:hypothetical protein